MTSADSTDESLSQDRAAAPAPPASRRPRYEAIVVTVVLVLWIWTFHVTMLSFGGLDQYDEFFTLDRTTSFARQGDWFNVYSDNEVTFRKPPLHYWIGALFVEQGFDLTIALRAPSMLFALGCLVATALLAAVIVPGNLWVMPAAVLLLASSRRLWISSTAALLDTGVLFFVTLSLAATILALRRPIWWYLVALAIGLGSLQKAPVALIFVALFLVFTGLTARWHPYRFRSFVTNRHFLISVTIAIGLSAAWYVFQFAQHGLVAISSSFGEQMLSRFAPAADAEPTRSFGMVVAHIIGDEDLLRWPALAALFILPWRLKRYDLLPLPMILLVYLVAIGFAGGPISTRYTLYFAGILAAALAVIVVTLPFRPAILVGAVVTLSLLSGGPVKSPADLRLFPREERPFEIALLSRIAADRHPEEELVYCNWHPRWRIPPGAVSYYGSNDRPFVRPEGPEDFARIVAETGLEGPLRGMCPAAHMRYIEPYLSGLEIVDTPGDYVYWTARAIRRDGN